MRRGEGLPVSYKCRRPTNCDMPIKMILEGSERGAEGQNRTVDTSLFRAVLCQLSYLGTVQMMNATASYQGHTPDFHIFCKPSYSGR